jgi:hypothetical protein
MAHTSTPDLQITQWLGLIRAEYLEMPGLKLTLPQACRLWRLDDLTSSALFAALVDAKFLRRTHAGAFVRADDA